MCGYGLIDEIYYYFSFFFEFNDSWIVDRFNGKEAKRLYMKID